MKKKIYASINVILVSLLITSTSIGQDPIDPGIGEAPTWECEAAYFYICRGCDAADSQLYMRNKTWPNCFDLLD